MKIVELLTKLAQVESDLLGAFYETEKVRLKDERAKLFLELREAQQATDRQPTAVR